MTTATLNGVNLATAVPEAEVVRVRRPFTVPRHTAVDVPGRAGSIIFPDEPGDRIVTVDVHIAAASLAARRTAVDNLIAWCYVGAVSALAFGDQADRYEEAILDASADPDEWLRTAGVITLPFRCGAYALANTTTTEALTAATNPDADTFSVSDNIDARPVITLSGVGGGIDSFVLTVNGSALSATFSTELDDITINTLGEVVLVGVSTDTELTGAYNAASVRMADVSGYFPLLTPGVNSWSLEWTGSATSVDIDIEWRERFHS